MRTQRGFFLLELAIAAAVAAMAAAWAASILADRVDDAAAESTGRWLLGVRHAVDRMLVREYDALAGGQDGQAAGYADPYAPTLAELKAHGDLPAGFPERPPLGGGAAVRVLREGACPGASCRVHALVHTLAPVGRPGRAGADASLLGAVVQAAGGYGGAVREWAPGRVRGALFDLDNPTGGGRPLPPGTAAAYAGLDAAGYDRYVRMRDTRDPELRGDFTVQGRVAAGSYLRAGAVEQAGTACDGDGLTARDAAGGPLWCRSGRWQGADGGFGGAYASNSTYGCRHYTGKSTANPRTGKCSCPAGYQAVIVSSGGKWSETEGWTVGYVCVG